VPAGAKALRLWRSARWDQAQGTRRIPCQRLEVLMVEDNRGMLSSLRAVMKVGFPYRFNVIQDGVEAVGYLRRQGKWAGAPRPDLIVLDLKLPARAGWRCSTTSVPIRC